MIKKISPSLLNILAIMNDLTFHDGESLGKQIGITRAAVWKIIQNLKILGVEIETHPTHGYKLSEQLELIDENYLRKKIIGSGLKIAVFAEIDSTNNFLKTLNEAALCIAEKQTLGKGRMGRIWHSPFGQNIYLSLSKVFYQDVSSLAGLSIAVSISCINAIKEFFGIENLFKIKWPNDGLYDDKKFMGILVEVLSENNNFAKVIIGVGINVNMINTDGKQELDNSWTSLREIFNVNINRNDLIIALYNNLQFTLEQFERYGFSSFYQNWHRYDACINKNISLNNGKIKGIAKGIDPSGNLLVEDNLGIIKSYSAGEVSFNKSFKTEE